MFASADAGMKAFIAVALIAIGMVLGAGLRGLAADAEIGLLKASHANKMKDISDAAAKASSDALKREQGLSEQIAAIDKIRTEENERAKSDLEKLRNDIAVGNRRLSVIARCPATPGVPEGAASPGVDHGATRAELDPAHAERIIAITVDGDKAIRQLSACQDYVRAITK